MALVTTAMLMISLAQSTAAQCSASMSLEEHACSLDALIREKQIPFWLDTVDSDNGGYFLNHSVEEGRGETADKFIITQSRMVWMFSWAHTAGYSTDEANLLDAARVGFEFISTDLFDTTYGGYYWSTNENGTPLDKTKRLQGQAFVILGFCEYYRASGDQNALDLALDLFLLIKEKALDTEGSFLGLIEDFTEDWTIIPAPVGGGPVGTQGWKTANGVMHMMEALTALYDTTKEDEVKEMLIELVDNIAPSYYPSSPKNAVSARTLDGDKAGEIPVTRFGHFVEYTWIWQEALQVLGRKESWSFFDKYVKHSIKNGIDGTTGGLLQEGNLDWWPQSEFMKLVAVDTRKNRRYDDELVTILDLWGCSFVDPPTGVSITSIKPDGSPDFAQLAFQWKSGFHEIRGMGAVVKAFCNQ